MQNSKEILNGNYTADFFYNNNEVIKGDELRDRCRESFSGLEKKAMKKAGKEKLIEVLESGEFTHLTEQDAACNFASPENGEELTSEEWLKAMKTIILKATR